MCVIMIVPKQNLRPTQIMMEKAWGRNGDGAGIAWRETVGGKKVVQWKKGLDEPTMQYLCKNVPTPYVAHWRIASCGGVRDELTHPFPIDLEASLDLEGSTEGSVLFHNGTWSNWDDGARYAAIQRSVQIPVGKWSDTRALAWLMSIYGHGFMELLPLQRGVAFGPVKMDIFTGPGWVKVNEIWCSNDFFTNFVPKSTTHQSGASSGNLMKPMCQYVRCTRNDIDADKRCPQHPKTSFPTNGYSTPNIASVTQPTSAPAVAQAQPTPFHQNTQGPIITVALAEMLHHQKNRDGSRRLSKNGLKSIKRLNMKVLVGTEGQKTKARAKLAEMSKPLLALCGRLGSTMTSGQSGNVQNAKSG